MPASGGDLAARHQEQQDREDEDDATGDEEEDGFPGELAVVDLVEVVGAEGAGIVADVVSPLEAHDGDWVGAEVPAMWRPV